VVGYDGIVSTATPKYEEFLPRTVWSLQNAFTSAINVLDPISRQKAQAAIGEYFRGR
jgi:hypothetical protein